MRDNIKLITVNKTVGVKKAEMKRLLEIVLEYAEGILGVDPYGLCWVSVKLWYDRKVTMEESGELAKYISNNMPSECAGYRRETNFYWPEGAIAPRVEWLRDHILLNIDTDGEE